MLVRRLGVAAVVALAAWIVPRVASATLEAEADAGFGQRALYGVPMGLATLRGTVGGRSTHAAGGVRFGFDGGATFEGLTVLQGTVGFVVEYVVDRARFGFGGGVGILSIPRATRGEALTAAFVEGTLRISVDLVRFGAARPVGLDDTVTTRPALVLASELTLNSATVWGPSLLLGVRY